MKFFKFSPICVFALLAVGCSSALKVQSDPAGIEVFVSQQDSKERKSIGKTPVQIKYSELKEKIGSGLSSGDMLVVELDSNDYQPEKVYVPAVGFGVTATTLQIKMTPRKDVTGANQILQRLHNAQKFAQSGQFERAQIEVDKVLEVDPQFVRALSMKGSIYYLQKNYTEAVKWYEKALAIDGSFEEAVKMIARIKAERN